MRSMIDSSNNCKHSSMQATNKASLHRPPFESTAQGRRRGEEESRVEYRWGPYRGGPLLCALWKSHAFALCYLKIHLFAL